ncbi:MAG: hypothetical protein HZB91_03925 [Elusimicrobia bacterium]|nr:hypothetical protein [Elusimicrobiota bacterium]
MDFDEIKTRFKILGAIFLLGGAFVWWQVDSTRKAAIEEASSYREPVVETPGTRYPRLGKVEEAGRSGKTDEALAQVRQIVSSSQDPAEKDAALQVLPRLLLEAFRGTAKAGSLDSGEALWKEFSSVADEGLREIGAWDLRSWAQREVEAGNLEASRRLMAMVLGKPLSRSDIRGYELLKHYRAFLLSRRSAAGAAGRAEEAEALFIEAASLDPWGDDLRSALQGTPAPELLASGKRLLASAKYSAALARFDAAWEARDLSDKDRAVIRSGKDECWLGLAAEAEAAGHISREFFISALSFLERADGPKAAEAASRLAALLEKQADIAAADKRFPEADAMLRQAGEKAEDSWRRRAFADPPDLWTGVDPETAGRVQKSFRPGVEQSNELSSLVMRLKGAESPLLECRLLAAKREGLVFDWALDEAPKNPDKGLPMLRSCLRRRPDAMFRAQADAAVRRLLRLAIGKKDLNRLTDVSAFLISELGPPAPGDPFHAELLSSLRSAAQEYQASSANKSVFILSLIADAFSSESAGVAAREAAITQGLAFFQKASESQAGGIALGPSGLDGLSVVSVENSTEHHMLIFYDGPERFFLRLNPYRRASAVFRDGTFSIGVMASADEVVPYRSKISYAGQRVFHRFVIERLVNGRKEDDRAWAVPASGDWTLLRVPSGSAGLSVDPATGQVKPAGRP